LAANIANRLAFIRRAVINSNSFIARVTRSCVSSPLQPFELLANLVKNITYDANRFGGMSSDKSQCSQVCGKGFEFQFFI